MDSRFYYSSGVSNALPPLKRPYEHYYSNTHEDTSLRNAPSSNGSNSSGNYSKRSKLIHNFQHLSLTHVDDELDYGQGVATTYHDEYTKAFTSGAKVEKNNLFETIQFNPAYNQHSTLPPSSLLNTNRLFLNYHFYERPNSALLVDPCAHAIPLPKNITGKTVPEYWWTVVWTVFVKSLYSRTEEFDNVDGKITEMEMELDENGEDNSVYEDDYMDLDE